ncbi:MULTISPECIES: hypothetical protein [Streptomyces]|uniref:hypothetical protein n=1 Tax=Streptomyces TaxID=1883 RepID=UPI000A87AB31|nr:MULTISPECIES: hypothetical protein [Streptomyces]MCI4085742.1 hypothetical protein [Streptomyces sp. MMS21 TC-5]
MSATNAAKRLGFAAVGALLAGGLLLAACTLPEDRPAPVREADGRGRQGTPASDAPNGR